MTYTTPNIVSVLDLEARLGSSDTIFSLKKADDD